MAFPVKIIQAKNGYILERTVKDNENEHWLFGSLSELFAQVAKHFNDEKWMNEQVENVNEPIPSYTE